MMSIFLLLSSGFASAAGGTVERIEVRAHSLEGNLSADSAVRHVSVYLPEGYAGGMRHYPVVYMLHGFTDSDDKWFGLRKHWIDLPKVLDKAAAQMIVVMPDAFTRFQGSMYSNSAATGDWETFVARELPAYIDAHYRTIPALRGLAGHSMGGYGTLRIGMKYPDVFPAVYALSPCCLVPSTDPAGAAGRFAKAAAIKDPAEIATADFLTKAMLASAAAWSPNPSKPPFYLDLPFENGEFRPEIAAKWAANAPLAAVDQYIPNLRRLAIAFDAGDKDAGIAAAIRTLDRILNTYKVPHFFEIYPGTHTDGIAARIEQHMVPFFRKAFGTAAIQ